MNRTTRWSSLAALGAVLAARAGAAPPQGPPPTSGGPEITLELLDTDVRDALRLVAKQGGVSIVMSPGVQGAVTLELADASLSETLDALGSVGGFEYTINGDIITVSTFEELLERRRQRADLLVESDAPQRDVLLIELDYVDAERVRPVVEKLLGEGGTASVLETVDHVALGRRQELAQGARGGASAIADGGEGLQIGSRLATTTQGQPAMSHTLVVCDVPERLERIRGLVDRIDVQPLQVLIEARFVEIALDDEHKLGIDWNVVAGANGATAPHTFPFGDSSLGRYDPNVTGGTSGGVFPDAPNSVTTPSEPGLFTFGTLDFSTFAAVLQMIQRDSRLEVVSNPSIVVGDRKTATILVGERYPILSANVSEFGTVTEELDHYEPIGVQLEVTPSVLNDDEIELFVRPSTSSLGALVEGSTGLTVARINTRQIDTSVTAKDRQTVVLGGLITTRETDTTRRVPFLGRIPLLGRLFTHEGTRSEKVDLVVFLTVSIQREQGLTPAQHELFEKTAVGVAAQDAAAPRTTLVFVPSPPRF